MQKRESIIYGIHAVIEAVKAQKEISKIYVQSGLRGKNVGELRKVIKEFDVPFQNVPKNKLDRLIRANHQGVVAELSPVHFYDFREIIQSSFEEGKDPFLLVLDRVSDTRNFGAICRTAECMGVDAIVIPIKGSAGINETTVKTSAGAIFNLPVSRVKNLESAVLEMKNSGITVLGITEKTDDMLRDKVSQGPVALILGSEEDGISSGILSLCHEKLAIPMKGKTSSLNVSVAAGIALHVVSHSR